MIYGTLPNALDDLFPTPIVCVGSSGGQCIYTEDFRKMRSPIKVPRRPRQHTNGRVVLFSDMELSNEFLFHCPSCKADLSLGKVSGVYFHPKRDKWIIINSALMFPNHHFDKTRGTLGSTRHDHPLFLEFEPGSYELINPLSILSEKLPRFRGASETILPDLPIKPEFMDLIDIANLQPVGWNANEQSATYKIPMFGLPKGFFLSLTYASADIIAEQDTFVQVWPDLPDWKAYWLSAGCVSKDGVFLEDWTVQGFNKNSTSGIAHEVAAPAVAGGRDRWFQGCFLVDGWPDFVWLGNNFSKAGGMIRVGRPEPSLPVNTQGTVCIDFGTSRTVVMVAPQDANDPDTFRSLLQDKLSALDDDTDGAGWQRTFGQALTTRSFQNLIKTQIDGARGYLEDYSYAPTSSHVNFKPNDELNGPSVLMVRSMVSRWGSEKIGEPRDLNDALPFLGFAITPTRMPLVSEDFLAEKWQLKRSEASVTGFLKALMLMAVCEHQDRYPGTVPRFSYSFPLAFSPEEQRRYFTALHDAGEWVAKCVPESMSLLSYLPSPKGEAPQVAFSESQATVESAMAGRYSDSVILVADLGGGTLDIGVWRPGATPDDGFVDADTDEEIVRVCKTMTPILSDSVKLGADHILEALLTAVPELGKTKREETKWDIFQHGYGLFQNTYGSTPGWENFSDKIGKWFKFIGEYISRMLVPILISKDIDSPAINNCQIVLAGGGWKTLEALAWTPEDLESELEDLLKTRIANLLKPLKLSNATVPKLKVNTVLLQTGLEKVAVAGGLGRLVGQKGLKPMAILTPNGLAEIDGKRMPTDWTQLVGLGRGRAKSKKWDGISIFLDDKSFVVPRIPGLGSISQNLEALINQELTARRSGTDFPRRSAISIVLDIVGARALK